MYQAGVSGKVRVAHSARYALVKQWRSQFPLATLCRTLDVSRSGFYQWLTRQPSRRALADARLKLEIRAAHIQTRETYGSLRLQAELRKQDVIIGRDRLARLRREDGVRCKQKRKFKATTYSAHGLPVAENLLEQNFKVSAPNQAWVSDITYIHTDAGWWYLAGIKDIFHGEIVGYAMSERMTVALVSTALDNALRLKKPAAGLIVHSDRGSQYCAQAYRAQLANAGLRCSMSRKGNCYDNAPIESFWGSLKNELVHQRRYRCRAEAATSVREYIEVFYNRQRLQKRLGYLSPAAFVQKFNSEQAALH